MHITAVDGLYHHYWGGGQNHSEAHNTNQKSIKQVTKYMYIHYEKVGGIQDSKAISARKLGSVIIA